MRRRRDRHEHERDRRPTQWPAAIVVPVVPEVERHHGVHRRQAQVVSAQKSGNARAGSRACEPCMDVNGSLVARRDRRLVGHRTARRPRIALQRPADAAVLADAPEVDRQQQRHGQRNGDAVQNVKPVQASPRPRSARPSSAKRASEALVIMSMPWMFSSCCPGPSCPRIGVARAMFEPTVMAQIANWSHGSR